MNNKPQSRARMVRPLPMESDEWRTVGTALDAIYNLQDEAVQHYVKRRWERLLDSLRKIETAARKAQDTMWPRPE